MNITKQPNGTIKFEQGSRVLAIFNASDVIITEQNDNGKPMVEISNVGRRLGKVMLIDPVSVNEIRDEYGALIVDSPEDTQELINALETLFERGDNASTMSYSRDFEPNAEFYPLADEPCKAVTLRNNANALFYTAQEGAEIEMIETEITTLYVTNSNQIAVKGEGVLQYIIDK